MFGGGGVGPPMGGGGAPGAAQAGLPFGGIPHELQAGVDVLLAEEAERGESDAVFTQLPSQHESKKLSLTSLLTEYPLMCALAALLVGHHRSVHPARPEPRLLRHQPRPDASPLRLRGRRGHGAAVPGLHRGLGRRAVGPGPGDGPPRLVGDERPAHQGVPAPPAAVARLLHRGEGRRRHEPYDERHREPSAAATGRAGPVRHSGADHARHHGLPVRDERDPGGYHDLRRPPATRRHVDLVQAGVRARLRQGPRRHRARCWPTSRRACRVCAS